jgi:hypothetical protein
MKHALIAILILACGPAWAAAPILETDGPTNANITAEVAIGSYTCGASNTMIYAQAVCLSGLTATAANIQYRLLQTTAADAGIANVDIVAKAKYATANTYFGTRLLGPALLTPGQKAVVYALSTNATDTVVSCRVDWIDALALPTGAAATTTVMSANLMQIHDTALSESTSGYLAEAFVKFFDTQASLIPVASSIATATNVSDATSPLLTTDTFNLAMGAVGTLLGTPAQAGEAAAAVVGLATTTNVTTSQGVITGAITAVPAAVWNYLMSAAHTVGSFGAFFTNWAGV